MLSSTLLRAALALQWVLRRTPRSPQAGPRSSPSSSCSQRTGLVGGQQRPPDSQALGRPQGQIRQRHRGHARRRRAPARVHLHPAAHRQSAFPGARNLRCCSRRTSAGAARSLHRYHAARDAFDRVDVYRCAHGIAIKTGKDLLEALRKDPGSLTIGYASTTHRIAAAMPMRRENVDVKSVRMPVFEGGKSIVMLLGGHRT